MMTSTAQRLLEATSSLSEPLLAEVLDFAEFLQSRQNSELKADADTPLAALCGGLSASSTFAGSSSDIQVRLRDEWL
jgi:hypothetical protein